MDLKMPEKSILDQIQWFHTWLAGITAMWGGLVSYFRRIQTGEKHSWWMATMHMCMSGFAGLMCWLGCVYFNVPGAIAAICTGLAGHMGAEFIKLIETKFINKISKVGE